MTTVSEFVSSALVPALLGVLGCMLYHRVCAARARKWVVHMADLLPAPSRVAKTVNIWEVEELRGMRYHTARSLVFQIYMQRYPNAMIEYSADGSVTVRELEHWARRR